MAAKLKTSSEFFLPGKLMARLRKAASPNGWSVDELVQDALQGYLRMVEEFGIVPDKWRAVPIESETEATIKEFGVELGDAETLHLDTALMIYFSMAGETKQRTGTY